MDPSWPRRAQRTPTRELPRLLALLGVCLMLLAQLGEAIHRDAVPHTQCAAHGEWVHAEAHGDASSIPDEIAAATQVASSEEMARARAHVEQDEPHVHGHHHCAFCLGSREQSVDAAVPLAFAVDWQPPEPRPVRAVERMTDGRSAWMDAPKTSPPHRRA